MEGYRAINPVERSHTCTIMQTPKHMLQCERSRSYVKLNPTIRFLDLKNIDLVIKIIILSALVSKVMVKEDFCKMVGNEMHSIRYVSRPNCIKHFLIHLKAVTQATLC